VRKFTPTEIVVFGGNGNDSITVATAKSGKKTIKLNVPLRIFGGDGNDTINASASVANTILVGGAGNDQLTGSSARDILIGSVGKDVLLGGGNDDILIAGSTKYDGDLPTLDLLMATWNGKGTYAARQRALLAGTATRPKLAAANVVDDKVTDMLEGQAGADWYFAKLSGAGARDVVKSRLATETVTAPKGR
jgi:Ca2+-binding RTX toxin-like protein